MIEGIVIGLFGLFALVGALMMPHALEFKGVMGFMIGAGFLPAVISATIVVLSVLLICSERKNRQIAPKPAAAPSTPAPDRRSRISGFLIQLGIFALFIFLMGDVPFLMLTFAYFIVFYVFAYRRELPRMKSVLKVLTLSIGATFFLAYLLPTFLQMPLP